MNQHRSVWIPTCPAIWYEDRAGSVAIPFLEGTLLPISARRAPHALMTRVTGGILRMTFARGCVDARISLDLTQQQIAARVGVSRSYIAKVELGQTDPPLTMVDRIAEALGLDVSLDIRQPVFHGGPRVRDSVHARCSAYVDRHLRALGWATAREVEIVHGRSHGWIDLLAFDQRTRTLLIIEIKTRLDDPGALERQLGWYERMAWQPARRLGWRPTRVVSIVLALASDGVERVVRAHRDLLAMAFPRRAHEVAGCLEDPTRFRPGRAP
jgi:transcriptional regulator with XRE-family HTH domain